MSIPMRQLPALIALTILVLVSGSGITCARSYGPATPLKEDKPNWSEAQVIDYLYAYLVEKAKHGGFANLVGKIRIEHKFSEAVYAANKVIIQEWTGRSPLDKASLKFYPLVYVDSLKRLAVYTGGNSWMITMKDSQWLVNEKTEEVKAENEVAEQLLRDVSRNSYYDVIYGYGVAYPAGWKIVKLRQDDVAFFDFESSELTAISIGAKVYKLKAEETLGEYASVIASLTGLGGLAKDYQLNSLIRLENGDYQADYEYEVEGTQMWGREYFKLHYGWVFMISYRTPKSMYEYWLPEFNYSYKSFGFRPITEWDRR